MKKEIEEYYEKYGAKVYAYLLGMSGDSDVSRELTQEVFVRAIGSLSSYSGSTPPRTATLPSPKPTPRLRPMKPPSSATRRCSC